MKRFYQLVSLIFHPILFPFIGTMYYFSICPYEIPKITAYKFLLIIFISTYLFPISFLLILKKTGHIKNFKIKNIEQRKAPVLLMIALFFMLGKYFTEKTSVYDIGTLFTGTSIALIFCYLFFSRNLKTSIHMIGMGGMIGFILNFSYFYQINMIIPLLIAFILSGIVGQARLQLKAHTPIEVYLGFTIGVIAQLITFTIEYY